MELFQRLRKSHFHLSAYGLWLLLPLIPIVSPWIVGFGIPPNAAAWSPLIIGFGFTLLLQISIPASLPVLNPNARLGRPWRLFLDALIIASVPLQVLMLFVSAEFWTSGQLNLVGSIAYLVGVGCFSGFCAINVGHELIHFHIIPSDQMKSKGGFLRLSPSQGALISKLLASLLLASVWFGTFFAAHLKIHHLHVGTSKDWFTAKRGQSIYLFILQNLVGNFIKSLAVEKESLASQGKTFLQSDILFPTVISAIMTIIFYAFWGLSGLIFFLGQAIVAIILLEWINYLQHYGIVRIQDSSGRIEPVREWHAWNEKSWTSQIFLLNLFRHSDHHMNPNKPFYYLSDSSVAPAYPYPYTIMLAISLIPPLFYSVTHRILDSHPFLGKLQYCHT
jgi:alkane 1-monooxygenase